jgi:[NiFe] hydrogenase assembly HybE family chaperone
MTLHADLVARWDRRVADLAILFSTIARTRMTGVPVLNAALRVEAIGFERLATDDDAAADVGVGVLVTPWFMNLVRLPMRRDDEVDGVGRTERHALGGEVFEFIGAHEPAIGAYSACSLFSPMFEFRDQVAARTTALAVLTTLRAAPDATALAATPSTAAESPPARRSFLFGRGAVRVVTP